MPLVHVETFIAASAQRCFDLMRDVNIHTQTTSRSKERVVGGKRSGLLERGDEVTWEAVHLGLKQRLTARVTRCEPPRVFEDEQVRGAFHGFTHRHEFREVSGGTLMLDDFRYTAPLGLLGVLADKLFLERYMRRFLEERARVLKQLAEQSRPSIPPHT